MKKVKYTDLPNGITVITEGLREYLSVSSGVWLELGSGDETNLSNGISHFYEHMVFKGAGNYSALDLVQKIERKGGYINAYTTRETTCFYTKTMASEWRRSLDILCKMVADPHLEKVEFEREREVILEEIQSAEDTPDDLSYDLLMEGMFGKCGLGLPIAGSLESVASLSHQQLLDHQRHILEECRIVVAVAGPVNHEEVVAEVIKLFANKKNTRKKDLSQKQVQSTNLFRTKDVGQCTVHLGTALGDLSVEQRLHLHLVHQMWGEGMSSRLFQNIREKHGLVYSIYSGLDLFRTESAFTVSLAAEENRLEKALELLHGEVKALQKSYWKKAELQDAIDATVGGMSLHRESTSNRMNSLARRVFSDLRELEFEDRIQRISAVSMEEVIVMTDNLWQGNWTIGAVVPMGTGAAEKMSVNFKA